MATTEPSPEQLFEQAVSQMEGAAPAADTTPANEAGTGAELSGAEPPVEKPEGKPAEAAAAKPAEEVEPDPFAALPEDTRAAIDKMRTDLEAKVKAAETEKQRHVQQVAGYEKNLQQARAALESAQKGGTAAQQRQAQAAVTAASTALAKMKEEYPSLAASIETIVKESTESLRREMQTRFDAELTKVKQSYDPLLQTHAQSLESAEMAAIEAAHPGWLDQLQTPEWKTWWGKQPAGVQALAKGDAADEIALFDLFRAAHPKQAQQPEATTTTAAPSAADVLATKRTQQLKDAAGPAGKRTPSAPTDADANDPQRLFDAAVKQVEREFHVA